MVYLAHLLPKDAEKSEKTDVRAREDTLLDNTKSCKHHNNSNHSATSTCGTHAWVREGNNRTTNMRTSYTNATALCCGDFAKINRGDHQCNLCNMLWKSRVAALQPHGRTSRKRRRGHLSPDVELDTQQRSESWSRYFSDDRSSQRDREVTMTIADFADEAVNQVVLTPLPPPHRTLAIPTLDSVARARKRRAKVFRERMQGALDALGVVRPHTNDDCGDTTSSIPDLPRLDAPRKKHRSRFSQEMLSAVTKEGLQQVIQRQRKRMMQDMKPSMVT